MRWCCVLCALLCASASAETLIGTILSLGENELQVKCPDAVVTLRVDEKTTIRKAGTFHDLTPLAAGDAIRFSFYGELPAVTAVNISASVTLSGVISESSSTHITVVPDSAAGDRSAGQKRATFVFLHPSTRFGTSRQALTVGTRVHVVGWDVSDGVVDADRVAVYNTDLPVRPGAGRTRK